MMRSDFMSELERSLEELPSVSQCEPEILLEFLYDAYFETQGSSSKEIKKGFQALYRSLERFEPQMQELIIDCVSSLCLEYERSGFIDGIKIGFRLKEELSI